MNYLQTENIASFLKLGNNVSYEGLKIVIEDVGNLSIEECLSLSTFLENVAKDMTNRKEGLKV